MTKDKCPRCDSTNLGRWIKIKNRKDHRQYRLCHDCWKEIYREQAKPIRHKLSRRHRSGVYDQ